MHRFVQKFLRAESGTTAVEYALIASLIIVAIVGAVQAVGQSVVQVLWDKIGTALAG